jgi:RNA polymerase sigma-70 factor, ECF subfamily
VPKRQADSESHREGALIAAARNDPEAFRDLYRRYLPRVYAYAFYRSASKQDAEDVVSEAFLRVAANLPRFRYRGEGSFAAWLFRIVNNQIADQRRRQKRSAAGLPLEAAAAIEDRSPAPGEDLERQEQFAELRRLVVTLAPQQQKVVLLRFFAGLRNREIARVLGLDERTVASHLSRGIQQLHQKYLRLEREAEVEGGHEQVAPVESRYAH